MAFEKRVKIEHVILAFVFTAICAAIPSIIVGAYIGFTSRDAQVNELRDAYRNLSVSKRAGEEARASGSAQKAKPNAVKKPSPQELWIRLQNANKKRKTIKM